MQNPIKVLLVATVLIVLHSAPGWSETDLNLTQQETKNEINKLKENIEKDYRNIESLNDLGVIYLKLEKYDQAIEQFKKALEVDPQYTVGPFLFGDIYTDAKNYQEKINDFKDVIKRNREYARAHNYLGLAYLKKKNYSAAKNSLLESIKVNPKYAKANNNLGVLYEEMGDTVKAIESYQMAQRIDPNDPDSLYNLGLVYDNLKDGDNSIQHMVLAKKVHEEKFGQEGIDRISKKLDQLEEKYTDSNEVKSVASLDLSTDDEHESSAKTNINQASIVSSAIPSLNPSKTSSGKNAATTNQTTSILKPQLDLPSTSIAPAMEKLIDQKETTTEKLIGTHHNQEKPIPNVITNIQSELIADAVIKENTFTDRNDNPIQTNLPSRSEDKGDVNSSPASNPEKQVIAHKKKNKIWASDWVFEYPK